jgi:hypothetical protein
MKKYKHNEEEKTKGKVCTNFAAKASNPSPRFNGEGSVMLPLPLIAKRLRCLRCIFMTEGESSYTRPPCMIDKAWKEGLAQCMHASAAGATLESMRLREGEAGNGAGAECNLGGPESKAVAGKVHAQGVRNLA